MEERILNLRGRDIPVEVPIIAPRQPHAPEIDNNNIQLNQDGHEQNIENIAEPQMAAANAQGHADNIPLDAQAGGPQPRCAECTSSTSRACPARSTFGSFSTDET